jgi:sulfite reductase beta subunit-like hemoprotein
MWISGTLFESARIECGDWPAHGSLVAQPTLTHPARPSILRMKWSGLFHRGKRTPGRFMQRLKVPQGVLTDGQLRALATCIEPYGEDGCADITTRANIQLRGIKLEHADQIMDTLRSVGLSSLMSGMDNIRNITGSPIAGIDPEELIDSRPLVQDVQDIITNYGKGNEELTNLPRYACGLFFCAWTSLPPCSAAHSVPTDPDLAGKST